MFKKKKQPEIDRLGRTRLPRTATRNAAVFSYYANRSQRPGASGRNEQPAATATRQQRPALLRRKPVLAALAVALVLVVASLMLTGPPRVAVEAGELAAQVPLRDPQAYTEAANRLFNESALNKNKLMVDGGKIAAGLRAQFPELARVNVSVPFVGGRPIVHVVPATPRLLLNAANVLYVIDASGRVIARANAVPNIGKLDLPVIVDHSGLAVSPGKPALSSGNVAFITEVLGQLEAKGLTATDIALPAGASAMEIRVSGAGYAAKFNLQGDGRVQAGAFLAVKEHLAKENKTPKEYIDVRVAERAYYK